jgi:hypothetical protein
MQMRLDDVLNLQPDSAGRFNIQIHVPLRVNHRRNPLRANQVWGVRKAPEVEPFNLDLFHKSPSQLSSVDARSALTYLYPADVEW